MKWQDLTLREQVYQLAIVTFREIRRNGGFEEFFKKYPVGGLYYSKSDGAQDLAALMESGTIDKGENLVPYCKSLSKYPLIVCADGANIGDNGKSSPLFHTLASANDTDLAYRVGRAHGMQMNYNHIDWILGPCIDLFGNHATDTISNTMTDDPVTNAKFFREVVRGTQDEGVAATVKHFPGLGTHHVNFHYGPGQNVYPFDKWMDTYGYSYKECFKEDVQCVMTSHLSLPCYQQEGEDGLPPIATFSKKLTIDLLKKELGFQGAVVTDALTMGGMCTGSQVDDAVNAFIHGADFLLWPQMEAMEKILKMLENHKIPMERLEDALNRIWRVREFLGMTEHDRIEKPVDPKFVDDTYLEASRRGMHLVRNEKGLLPLDPSKHQKILVIGNAQDENGLKKLEPFVDKLNAIGFKATYQHYLLTCWEDEMIKIHQDYDYVMLLNHCPFTVGPIAKCASTTWAFHLVPQDKRMILNFSNPFFASDYYPDDKTFVNVLQAPNDDCFNFLLDKIIGKDQFEGISPVKLSRFQ